MAPPAWAYIPDSVLDDEQRANDAKTWAAQQYKQIAGDWAALQDAQAPGLPSPQPPVRDNWAVPQDALDGVSASAPLAESTPTAPAPPVAAPFQEFPSAPTLAPPTGSSGFAPVTPTTVQIGQGQRAGEGTGDRNSLIAQIGDIARQAGLGDEGAKVAQAIVVTEGGLTGDVGDVKGGGSYGPFQFYWQGQLKNYAKDQGMGLDQAAEYARTHPLEAAQWALTHYLGQAIQSGMSKGLNGADLATYAQRTGQVSDSPERAGKNYDALFGGGSSPFLSGQPFTLSQPSSQPTSSASPANNPLQGIGDAVGGAAQGAASTVSQATQSAQDLIQQSFTRLLSPEEQNRLSDHFRQMASTMASGQEAQGRGMLELGQREGRFLGGTVADLERQQRERDPFLTLTPAGIPDVSTAVTAGLERAGVPGHQEAGVELGPFQIGPREGIGLAAGMMMPGGPAGKGSKFEAALNVPANQKTAAMLAAGPAKQAGEGLVNDLVRAWTNRFEAADRFQESILKNTGLSTANPPEAFDLSARVRQFATDGSVKVAEDNVLKPAVQSLGGDPSAQKLLSSVLVHQNNVDVAAALGQTYRQFPGGGSLIQSQTALRQMEQQLGPAEWQKVKAAADQVYSLVKGLRQTMLDSGLIDQHDFNTWNGQYPHWVPTRILDYLDEAGGPKVGAKISLSDNGVRHYTLEGTDKFQEDPLASVLGLVGQVESKARKNEAVNALIELDKLSGKPMLQPTDAPVKAGEAVVQYIREGQVERYIAPPQLAAVINGPQITQAPGFVRNWTNFQRAVTTILSPTFALVRNPSLDVPEYLTRELSRAGGNPLALPHIVAELARGYGDAFQGLLQGEFRGSGAQQFIARGGSGSGLVSTFEGRQNIVQGLSRATPFELKSIGDLQRLIRDLVTLKPVAAVAERTEQGPRIASMRLAEQHGQTSLRSIQAGRTVTMDFNEGGTVAKTINQFIPFFNAGVQGSAIPARMFRENPAGAIASTAMMVGLPAIVAEAWNRSDPQRSADYDDVPQYLKQGGVVVMAPGQAPVDAQGNRKPQFYWINMRGLAPFAQIARESTAASLRLLGNGNASNEDWGQLLTDIGIGSIPIRANTVGDVPGALLPNVAGASTGLQLATNKDFFRNRDISSQRNDESASQASKDIAGALTYLARLSDPSKQVHPSQVDFAVRDLLGGVGSTALGAYGVVRPDQQNPPATPQQAPVLGGLIRAAGVRSDTGEQFQQARQHILTPEAQRILQHIGLDNVPAPLQQVHDNVPLTVAEETTAQRRANEYLNQLIMRNGARLEGLRPEVRRDFLNDLVSQAHDRAVADVLRNVPAADRASRRRAYLQKQTDTVRQAASVP